MVIICVQFLVTIQQSANQVNRGLALREKLQHMDAIGTILFLGAVTCLLLVLQWAGQAILWRSATTIGLSIGSALLTILFNLLQTKRGEYTTIQVRVFKKRSIYMGAAVLFWCGMSSLTVTFLLLTCVLVLAKSCIVCLFPSDLFSIHTRCFGNEKRRQIHCPSASTNCRSRRCWGNCVRVGILCKHIIINHNIRTDLSTRFLI